MIINITFDRLANAVESFYNIELINNCEIDITSLGITVPTPSGPAVVSHIIKKERLPGVIITTKAGRVAKTAKKHILVSNDTDIFADELSVGDSIVTQNGQDEIVSIVDAGCFDCYDIAVPSPHYYYDAAGILHHNTIITATLAKRVEQYGRSLVIVPNKSLVSQTEDDFKLLGLDVGVYFGDRKEVGRTHTIVTWQSLSTIMRAKKKGEESKANIEDFTNELVCVMVDECFAKDTPVLTPTGYVPIQSLKPGDKIINFSEKTNSFKEDTVVKLHQNLPKASSEKMYELEFGNDIVLRVTGNHKFLTTTGWVRADELTSEHDILSITT